MHPRRFWLIVSSILVGALVIRLCAIGVLEQRTDAENPFVFGDSYSYWVLAEQVVAGESYEYAQSRVFRAPGYPLILACVQKLFGAGSGGMTAARVLGAVFGVLTTAAVMLLAHRVFGSCEAILAGAMTAVYPGAVGMSILILSEAPFCPLMVSQLVLWTAASGSSSSSRLAGYSLLGGIAGGLATLIRPSWLFFTPVLVGGLLMASWPLSRKAGQTALRQALIGSLMLLAASITMLPWWVRNYQLAGRFIPTTLELGASLYDGWNPQATGASDMRFVESFRTAQREADRQNRAPDGLFESRLDQRLKEAALTWAGENPLAVIRLSAIKIYRMWSPWPHAEQFRRGTLPWAICLGYVPLVVLSLCGLKRSWQLGWLAILCWMPAVYFTFLHSIFVSSIRYRQPAMLPLIVISAAALCGFFIQSTNAKSRARLSP